VVTTAARRLHEVGFYRSDAEFGALIVPFVEEGRYQDPAVFEPLPPDPDPLERLVPALVLADPSAFQARQAVTSIGYGRLADAILPDLVIGVSEAVSNAWRHGRPPVMVRIWTASGRMLVRVHDTGPGPGSPLAGLAPAWAGPGLHGAGLWLIRMLGLDATLIRSRDGFTVRLAAGQPGVQAGHLRAAH